MQTNLQALMQPLPHEFLTKLARDYDLSEEQQQVFIALYSGQKKQEIIDSHHISDSAFSSRMTGVYQKFHFGGKGHGKKLKLHGWLMTEYQKSPPRKTPNLPVGDEIDIDELVKIIRGKVKADIENRCGKMQVLDMTQSIGLDDIYTEVNILQDITDRSRYSIKELMQNCDWENFDRLGFGKVTQKRLSGLTAVAEHRQLMVWGKPGSGKTTFLKYLATQCIGEKFLPNHVPIFVTLKDFADNSPQIDLENFIQQQFTHKEVTATEATELLKSGRGLILLDGLDEVREEDSRQVIDQIQHFANRYQTNYFITTCRIAAREYTFQGFKEVEVADFNHQQIETFVGKWFVNKDQVKGEKFLEKLENNQPIKELATNPLLLTLLCLVFGENTDFPASRSELYEEGVDVLLKKWDGKRNIERDVVYERLSLKRKENLLAQIAEITFRGCLKSKKGTIDGVII